MGTTKSELFSKDQNDLAFIATSKQTDCLTKDKCGIPQKKLQVVQEPSCCTPGSGCC